MGVACMHAKHRAAQEDKTAARDHASVVCRGEACGQLKVSVTAPGQTPSGPVLMPQPANTTAYQDSASQSTAVTNQQVPVAVLVTNSSADRRLRADITSVAAPVRPIHPLQSIPLSSVPALPQLSPATESATVETELPPHQAAIVDHVSLERQRVIADPPQTHTHATTAVSSDVRDPRQQLKTQMQQLDELSQLMSQRLSLGDADQSKPREEALQRRADAVSSPQNTALSSDGNSSDHNAASESSSFACAAQRAQHDGDPQQAQHDLPMTHHLPDVAPAVTAAGQTSRSEDEDPAEAVASSIGMQQAAMVSHQFLTACHREWSRHSEALHLQQG